MDYAIKRTYWQELKRSLRGCRPKLSLSLCMFEENFTLCFFGFHIPLLFLQRWHHDPEEMMESWGFTYFDRTIHWNWGSTCKIIHMPWDFEHIKHEVMRPDGSWAKFVGCWEHDKEPDGRWQADYPYRYVLKSGEVQDRIATVYVGRREWRWRWFTALPWPSKRRQSIDVAFNGEVGERTGSWKGGVIGTGYDMKRGETPEQTLRRMEREHKM